MNDSPAPSSMLEVYMFAISSPTGDDFLDKSNLGLGNYNKREYWQQITDFQSGLYANAAMTRRLVERGIHEAKVGLAKDAYHKQSIESAPAAGEMSEQEYVDEYADVIWESLGNDQEEKIQQQIQYMEKYANMGRNWVPPHWRILKMRHEASRSKGARLIDNLFERVREVKNPQPEEPEL